jgi:hypothetical protein
VWPESETTKQMRQLYPDAAAFATGHLPYVFAVTATLIARGIPVRETWTQPTRPGAREDGTRTAHIEIDRVAWQARFPDSAVPLVLQWSESFGWNYTLHTGSNNGLQTVAPATERGPAVTLSRGLGYAVALVADPHDVADGVQALLAGKHLPEVGWAGRSSHVQDLALESALAAYRTHPGASALAGSMTRGREYWITPQHILRSLDTAMLAAIARQDRRTHAPARNSQGHGREAVTANALISAAVAWVKPVRALLSAHTRRTSGTAASKAAHATPPHDRHAAQR